MKFIIYISILFSSTTSLAISPKSKCIAHRGNNIDHIENTRGSFVSAYELGSHGIELDIRHTKDGIGIVFHDSRPRRLLISRQGHSCRKLKKIKNQTFKQLNKSCKYENGEKILTLENFLRISSGWNIWRFFEFKDLPSESTLSLLKEHIHDYSKVKFISFKSKALSRTLSSLKNKVNKEINFLKLYYFWLPGKPKWTPNFPIHSYWLFSKRFLRLNKYYSLGIWVIDDIDSIIWAKKSKVEFITTNDPLTCLKY